MPRAPKVYPLETHALYEDGCAGLIGYFSKGHHEDTTFIDAVKAEHDGEVRPAQIQRVWRRWVICAGEGWGGDDWVQCLYPARQGQRGAFPVTMVEFD